MKAPHPASLAQRPPIIHHIGKPPPERLAAAAEILMQRVPQPQTEEAEEEAA